MQKIFFSFLAPVVMASCNNKKTEKTQDVNKDTTTVTAPVTDNNQKVTYQSAIYYTGRVEFHFQDEKGGDIRVDISNMPEDSGAVYPKYLLESGDTLEGPPSANPAMVGKPFLLVKNAAGEVKEIKAVN